MNATATRRIAQFFALPIVAAGILAAALGFAGAANAGTYTQDTTPRPGLVATPQIKAHPAPGTHHGHGITHLQQVQPNYHP
ncbi:hypothetical protein AU197_11910 [Mycobacterium sp. IS-1590]|uniref:hypothetical protein n=1 Tax=Mycobacterium sp. IS-1590 TaxID=1772286 RepID=UPI0007466A3B|nr:hypothetical protein [Mycobacterium sp. IS-1590]KUI45369.1 hypothetical protein AU197_11910 [Mycobacterium sp. IS-1590]